MKNLIIALTLLLIVNLSFGQEAFEVVKSGKGSPVVYLPGFTTPGSVWNETIENINGNYENHVFTYAGFGGVKPIGTPWYAPLKNQIVEYIKKEKLSDVTIIGHSMGGNLAIDIAAELPDQIEKLVLVESIPCMREVMMPGVPANSLQYDSPYNQQMLNMSEADFKQMAVGMANNMSLNQSKHEDLTSWIINADKETYVYGYTDLLKLDLRDKLSNINAEALILGASFPSKSQVQSTYENQYANLKNKTIAVADQSKHFIMFDQPEWMYKNINGFLNQSL